MTRTRLPFATFALFSLCAAAWADDKITVHYNERPPYLKSMPDGSPGGLTGTPAVEAFKKAGIAVSWAKTPTSRQLDLLEKNEGKDCAVGWFKNPKRESFAKFTKAIYRDKPWVAVANSGFAIKPGAKLEELLSDKKTRLLVKDGFSYGSFIDGLLARTKPTTTKTTGESPQMVQMIKADRADLMLASQEEAAFFIESAGLSAKEMKTVSFPDVPEGEKRYIMCSKKVGDDVIAKLNKAINFE
jgi:uncharacterized protein (TIGR02285 family)